jgi:hypothetical protein
VPIKDGADAGGQIVRTTGPGRATPPRAARRAAPGRPPRRHGPPRRRPGPHGAPPRPRAPAARPRQVGVFVRMNASTRSQASVEASAKSSALRSKKECGAAG